MCCGVAQRNSFCCLNNTDRETSPVHIDRGRFDSVGFNSAVDFDISIWCVNPVQREVITKNNISIVAFQVVDSTFNRAIYDDISLVFDDDSVVGHGESDAFWEDERFRHGCAR